MTVDLGATGAASLAGAFALGLLIGAVYFGGLWWTLARLGRWRRPGVAVAVSFALRAAFALALFAGIVRLGLAPLGAAFIGFLVVRIVASQRVARDRASGGNA